MKKKLLFLFITTFVLVIFGISISVYAKWVVGIKHESNPVVDATYKVKLVNGTNETTFQLLEIESYFYLPNYENDLDNEKFFLGWSLTNGSTADITVGDKQLSDYKANLADNLLTLYAIWTTTVPTDKTLLTVNYPTNQTLKLLVDSSKTFYLFNINVPGKIDSTFLSYFTSENTYDYTKYSGIPANGNRFELNDYFESTALENYRKITLTAVYE